VKRGLNTTEAMAYLGVRRRAFESMFLPLLRPFRIGTSTMHDIDDLDRAWSAVKEQRLQRHAEVAPSGPAHNERRNGRPTSLKGVNTWAETHGASTPTKTVPGKLTSGGEALDFASVASKVLGRRKAG
jgi:hypothetical protein